MGHYGINWVDNLAWLVQGRSATNFVGLNQRSPITPPTGGCNHLIPTAAPIPDNHHWEIFQKLLGDPLIQAMLPIPHDPGNRCFYLEDPQDKLGLYLTTLSRLTSPIQSVMKPAWMFKMTSAEKELQASNIQPLILTQTTAKQQDLVTSLAKLTDYAPRTIIISGNDEVVVPQQMKRIQTKIQEFNLEDLILLPLEALGATVIRRFARHEALEANLESRDERRNRMIAERKKTQ